MKQQLKWLSFLALAALTAACTNEEEIVPRTLLPADGQIRVIASVNAPATRAGATTANLDNFGLFVVPEVSVTEYTYKNVYMKKDGSTWKSYTSDTENAPGVSMMWQNANAQVFVRAYAPYSSDNNGQPLQSNITGSVLTAQNEPDSVIASDFLFSSGFFRPSYSEPNDTIYYDAAQQAISVKMKHYLSKLRVNISYLKDITDKPSIKSVTLQGTTLKYTVNLRWGTLSEVTEDNEAKAITLYKETTETGYVGTYEAIVVPQQVQFSVRVKVGENEYLYQHPDKDDKAFTFESGKLYTLNLTVGKAKVSAVTISSKGWTDVKEENIETD